MGTFILITLAIIAICFFIVVSYANGLMRGIKLLSTRGIKKTHLEKLILEKTFNEKSNVDPFFMSFYVREEMEKKTAEHKKKVTALKKISKKPRKKTNNGQSKK
jgi:hypothetical protein